MILSLAEEVQTLRRMAGFKTQKALAEAADLSQPFIHKLETGKKVSFKPETMKRLTNALRVPKNHFDRFLPADSAAALSTTADVPYLGPVKAGPPAAMEDVDPNATVNLRDEVPQGCVAFRVSGVSMAAKGIFDGDLAVVRPTQNPNELTDGDIVIARVDGSGYTLKGVDRRSDTDVFLVAFYKGAPPVRVRPGDAAELVGVLVRVIGERKAQQVRKK